ncbi:ribosomal protection-like ABC-F family protein [Tetragenococcus halophilus]|uniref:ABC-F type ribosomal protection protein n=1 Tax=Tetragenococcus halophilus TaxID=51669 RepID=A0AB35HR76_TETHA|nr:ABC-F type ribosomal protection protein [Tetragenococcus halophilus]MCO8294086.1 ABC-F type ribosomal protection protein [Tetragenococcus halophilus]MCO8296071.1 ABC-F type ribosomal protection protein [Tetragenococcus halophilus]MCO8298731.1 ABC-F type ribosomal protection protein [Tetragenococcus halophilus]MDN6724027.1 ABC-F type ribosomal protection protein [Tetragenococcus halophilus]GMG71022.1 ABC-F type ribosomal protection protein Lsa(A) [Tetragenococcus halophilus]
MSKIEIKDLTFGFDNLAEPLFDHTNLTIDTQWKLGLIGRNGRGKTTLLQLLLGKYAYSGIIKHQLEFTYFPQKISDKTLLTYDCLQALAVFDLWEIERELNLLQTNPEILWRPFDSLSGGEQTKILLALLFIDDHHFPLIDEPTNHLDIMARQQVANYLQAKRNGFIVVSHDRSFVNEVVDHVLSIEKSQLVLYQGNFSTYEEQKEQRDHYEQEENRKLKKEIGRLKQTAAEKAEWSRGRERDKQGNPNQKGSGAIYDTGAIGARAARTMKRSKAIVNRMEEKAEEKKGLLHDIEDVDSLTINYQPSYHKQLLKVEKLQLSYTEQPLFSPISFEIEQGQRLAIQGANGSGKSSIIQFLLDEFTGVASGKATFAHDLSISYVRQNYEDNTGTLQEFAQAHHLSYEELLNNLHKLGVERKVFANRIEKMSLGQRKRVELAKSLATPAELFIWDEPLNYLDVFNHEQLEAVIQSVQPSMLVVEHEATFLKNIATKMIYL